MTDWWRLLTPPGPDRVERLLASCRAYYQSGDPDIAVLLLREAEKELLTKTKLIRPAAP